jgi:glutathione S-transferase
MILYSTPTSPYGRKVKIAARIFGLMDRIQIEPCDPWTEGDILRQTNPLGKMPALVLDNGQAVYDSGVILDYFDTLLGEPQLFPKERRLAVQVTHALINGMMDAGILIAYERLRRPGEFCYEPWIDHQRGKIERGLASLVKDAPNPRIADAASISLACALGYFDWRKQLEWRKDYPALVGWLETFSATFPAFEATKAQH